MLANLKQRLTYANVTATLALFVALGGSSYAALSLPRNSVGANQIRVGAVGTSEIRDRSVTLTDINRGTRQYLRGRAGPTWPRPGDGRRGGGAGRRAPGRGHAAGGAGAQRAGL
jgi:hypothetical protein